MATEHRKNRIYQTLINRQNDLVIVLDEVHDDHNVNAILRSSEAVGVSNIYLKTRKIPSSSSTSQPPPGTSSLIVPCP